MQTVIILTVTNLNVTIKRHCHTGIPPPPKKGQNPTTSKKINNKEARKS